MSAEKKMDTAVARRNILIVDDNPEDRHTCQRFLSQEHTGAYTLLESDSGEEGLRIVQSHNVDCILLDYRLPDLDGLEFLVRLQAEQTSAMIPVVLLTGQGNEWVAVQAMKMGAQDYLVKDSLNRESLNRALNNAIDKVTLLQKVEKRTAELSQANAELTREIAVRKAAEETLQNTYERLELLVQERTAELSRVNADLVREIDERRKIEEERSQLLVREREARKLAENVNRVKDEFLATLSHELRTPLNAILGWTSILQSESSDQATQIRACEVIERNAKSLAQLIADLLDVSSIISGKLQLTLGPVEFPQIIHSVLDTVRSAAEAKSIDIVPILDPVTRPMQGDSDRLQQILWNLLSNAIKFTPRGGHVEVRLRQSDTELEVEVKDTGIGIHSDFLPQVFDRFSQQQSTTTRSYGGLGLGLAIVRQLTELHGGSVRVKSQGENQGSTFTLTFPVPRDSRATPDLDIANSVIKFGGSLDGLKLLVVEDEPDSLELTARILERSGASVRSASSVVEALELLEQYHPDVLISDIAMPGEDGNSLIRKLRSDTSGKGLIPAVALTAGARVVDRIQALSAGFQEHLTKPLNPKELVAVVQKLGHSPTGSLDDTQPLNS